MLALVILLLLAGLSFAFLLMAPALHQEGRPHEPSSRGDVGKDPVVTSPPVRAGEWRDAVEHLQVRLDQATATQARLEQDVTRLEREKATLEAKYLAKVKSAEEKKQRLDAWRKKQTETRKGLSDQAAEIVAGMDKWLPHAREEKATTGKRGKPVGSGGGGRKRPEVIHYQKHVWPSKCPDCGAGLEGAREKKPYSSVLTDLENLQVNPKDYKQLVLRNVEIFHHGRWCAACKKWVYNDLGAIKWARYGLNFVIYVISKRIATRMPFELITWELDDQFGLALTLQAPTIVDWFQQHEEVLKEVYAQLQELARGFGFEHIDETGLPLRGENWWVWVVCNAQFALFIESRTRGYAAVEDLLEDYDGALVNDCWSAYGKAKQEQQKCLGHLVSSTNEVIVARQKENTRIEKEDAKTNASGTTPLPLPSPSPPPSAAQGAGMKKRGRPPKPSKLTPGDMAKLHAVWAENDKVIQRATRLKEFLGGAWKEGNPLYWKAPPDQRMTHDEAEQQLAVLVQNLREGEPPDPDFRRILDRCEKHAGQWFTYLKYEGMPPDNNQAERDLRSWAVQRKISGGFHNEQVVRAYLLYKSLFVTCQKNHKDFRVLLEKLLGRQKVDLLEFFYTEA